MVILFERVNINAEHTQEKRKLIRKVKKELTPFLEIKLWVSCFKLYENLFDMCSLRNLESLSL